MQPVVEGCVQFVVAKSHPFHDNVIRSKTIIGERNRMTRNMILKKLLNIKGAIVENVDFAAGDDEMIALRVRVRPNRRNRWRCPACGRKCPVYDHPCDGSTWRSMDFGPASVYLVASVPRVCCPEHGVLAAAVPWARPGTSKTVLTRFPD